MTAQPKLYTYADFEAFTRLPENKDRLFELVHGEIIEVSPTQEHGLITALLVTFIQQYLMKHPIGWVFVEARYKLPDDDNNSYIPDLSFVRAIEGREVTKKGAAPYLPEFAVEIKSPDDDDLEMRAKAIYYLKHGVEMVWLIITDKKKVEVHTLDSVQTFNIEDTLDGGMVLPDFKVTIKDLFKNRPGE